MGKRGWPGFAGNRGNRDVLSHFHPIYPSGLRSGRLCGMKDPPGRGSGWVCGLGDAPGRGAGGICGMEEAGIFYRESM